MVAGDHGHPGMLALLHAAVASKTANVFVTIQYPCMAAKTVWETQKPASFATNKPVQSVSYNITQPFR